MLELSNYWDDFEVRVNKTIDRLEEEKLPDLERLTVHLTEGCNFRCEYCNMKFSQRTMDKKLAYKIVDDYVAMGGNIIHFTGGEPTIVSYIEKLYTYAKTKGLQVSSNTNGFKKVSSKNIDKLKASFDTPFRNEFNNIMNVKCFNSVVKNLKQYSQEMKNKMLSITAVLNRKTYKHMLDLAKFINENFEVYNLYFSNYKGCNEEFAFEDWQIEDMFKNHIPETLDYFKNTGNTYSYNQLSLYTHDDFRNVDCRFQENLSTPCYIQLSEMTIDVDGNCYDCSHLYRDGVVPNEIINVERMSLSGCFVKRKKKYKNILKSVCISDKCLNGCNKNLIGFNKAVANGKHIGDYNSKNKEVS